MVRDQLGLRFGMWVSWFGTSWDWGLECGSHGSGPLGIGVWGVRLRSPEQCGSSEPHPDELASTPAGGSARPAEAGTTRATVVRAGIAPTTGKVSVSELV